MSTKVDLDPTTTAPAEPAAPDRGALRARLLADRTSFALGPEATAAQASLGRHLGGLLMRLEPSLLGLYWPRRSEFNAAAAFAADNHRGLKSPSALPFAFRSPPRMDYRGWNGEPPRLQDECGIATSDGPVVVPDVVVVPCVGFTRDGFRLGYGGGYFDRWLASHPATTAIGVAGSFAEIRAADFQPLPHDLPLMLIVTERGIVSP